MDLWWVVARSGHLEQLWVEKWCVVPSPMSLWTWNQQQCDIDHTWHWQRLTHPQSTRKQRIKQVKPYKQQQDNFENPKHTLRKTKVWNFQLPGNRTLKLEGGKGKLRCWHDRTYQREREIDRERERKNENIWFSPSRVFEQINKYLRSSCGCVFLFRHPFCETVRNWLVQLDLVFL